jgi:hypothetical protein
MDVNDIKSRLERLYSALKSRIDHDFKRHAKTEQLPNGGVRITLPGVSSQNEMENNILSILHHLATAKDNLKKHLRRKGHNEIIVENTIKSSFHLQVLLDLVNADKHGTPLKISHSGKNLIIKDIRQGVINNNHGKPIIATISTKGEMNIVVGLPPSVGLFANIYDDKGNYLFDFDTLVEVCYSHWMNILNKHN